MDQPKVQTDDHYTIDKNEIEIGTLAPSDDHMLTTHLRWSKDGKLQQEVQYLGSGKTEWIDVPKEKP